MTIPIRGIAERTTRRDLLGLAALGILAAGTETGQGGRTASSSDASHISLAPAWLDPAEAGGRGHAVLGALRAARRADEAYAGQPDGAASLAESWKAEPRQADLRIHPAPGLKFHNGDPFTAEDAIFSFERAKGRSSMRR